MIGIRQKLVLGFGGLLLIVAAMGVLTIRQIDALGGAIDVILKQNYRSVIACQEMTESLERIDSGVLIIFAGHDHEGVGTVREYEQAFRTALRVELGNITLPGEHEKARKIQMLFERYTGLIDRVSDSSVSVAERERLYFSELQPLFRDIKVSASIEAKFKILRKTVYLEGICNSCWGKSRHNPLTTGNGDHK